MHVKYNTLYAVKVDQNDLYSWLFGCFRQRYQKPNLNIRQPLTSISPLNGELYIPPHPSSSTGFDILLFVRFPSWPLRSDVWTRAVKIYNIKKKKNKAFNEVI